jgi:hypothetical protein
MRLIAVAVIAVFGITAVAIAQQNQYEISGTATSGGTKKKPKAAKLSFGFKTTEAAGNLPSVIRDYRILFEGGKVNSSKFKGCTAAQMDAAKTDEGCPAESKLGSGKIDSLIGSPGQAANTAAKCLADINIYNSGGGKAALWIKASPPACIATLAQAIPSTWVKEGNYSGLAFTVPESLRHQLGLDIAVVDVTTNLPGRTKKKGKKKLSFFEGVGCTDAQRELKVTFTDETGNAVTTQKNIGKC